MFSNPDAIILPDKDAFRWLLLNLLGHDFYHDYNGIIGRVKAIKNKVFAELDVLLQNYHFYEMTIKGGVNGLEASKFSSFLKDVADKKTVLYGGGGGKGLGSQDGDDNSADGGTLRGGQYMKRWKKRTRC